METMKPTTKFKLMVYAKMMFIVFMLQFSQSLFGDASHWTEFVLSFVLFAFGGVPLIGAIEDAYRFKALKGKMQQILTQAGEKP